MKRLLAGLLILCSLLSILPGALAAPAEEEDPKASQAEEETPEEDPDKTQKDDAESDEEPEKEPEQDPEKEEKPSKETAAEVLASETAIDRMEVRVHIDDDGFATVLETVEMHIIGSVEKIRFSFPAGAKKCDIAGYWTKSETDKGLRYLTIKDRKGFSGKQTFTLSYTINPQIEGGDTSQILTLPLLSEQDYKIGYFIFQVTMPKNFASKPYFVGGYYSDLVEEFMSVVVEDTVITGAINEIVRNDDTLTMTHVLPEKFFSGSYGESRLSPVLTTIIMLLLVVTLFYWYRTLRNGSLRVNSRSLPPDGVTPGDVPFLLAGGQADFNMLVTHWAVLGYVSFFVNKGSNIIIQRRMDMGNERRPFERRLFALLFGRDDICEGASLQYKRVGAKAAQIIPRYWSKRLYDKRSGSVRLARGAGYLMCALATLLAMDAVAPAKGHFLYLVLGFIAGAAMAWLMVKACSAYYLNNHVMLAAGIVSGLLLLIVGGLGGATYVMLPSVLLTIFMGWQTLHGGLRKACGDELVGQTLGFRRFLRTASEEHIQQMQRRDSQYFYKILPYAEAMGQGKRFASLFRGVKLEPCQWYESAREMPGSAQAFYDRYVDMLELLNISLKK